MKENYKVGDLIEFLYDYGGHPKGIISRIVEINNEYTVTVEHLYLNTKEYCNLMIDKDFKLAEPVLNEAYDIY